ncbi:TPA: restriction endonuclease subunit S [Legionella pneumophila]
MELFRLSTITAGHSFRGKIPETKSTGIYVVQMKDIDREYTVNWDTLIETKLTGRQSANWVKYGDILFAARGQRNYATLIDSEINNRQVIAAPQFFVIHINHPDILPEYLAWFLNQSIAQRYFQSHAEGSTTPSIRRQVLESTPIVLPSLKQQKIIIELAKTISREKQLANRVIANGEQLMQSLLNEISQHNTIQEEITSW